MRMLQETGMIQKLDTLTYPSDDDEDDECYHIYGDKGYQVEGRLSSPYEGNNLTADESWYNMGMSTVRVLVENTFGKVVSLWPYIDYPKRQKVFESPIGRQYIVAVFLTNCHSCFYQNLTAKRLCCRPPFIEAYLHGL
jgi:hypothetical protein